MEIYYLLPVILIGGGIAFSIYMRKRAASMTPAQAADTMHNYYAGYFRLQDGEKIIGTWSGVELQKPKSAASQAAGAALNMASGALIGVSTYVPNVQVALTSTGRVLVSREHSELGERGHFNQYMSFDQGAKASDAASAYPGADVGPRPKNPFNPVVNLEFVHLEGANGSVYDAWMSPQGGLLGRDGFVSIIEALAK